MRYRIIPKRGAMKTTSAQRMDGWLLFFSASKYVQTATRRKITQRKGMDRSRPPNPWRGIVSITLTRFNGVYIGVRIRKR
jgi:hypothetical protein